jgi:predicted NAD/FAD-dependent oxidoreductase
MEAPSVLIIGAGMAGLTAARTLQDRDVSSVLLDKGRKPGGRMATRSVGEASFDHGAQHFGMRDPEFRRIANEWMAAGIVREWFHAEPTADGTPNVRHNGRGGMRRIAEHVARGLSVRTGVTVDQLEVRPNEVVAFAGTERVAKGAAVIVTAPVPQSLQLLAASSITIPAPLGSVLEAIRYNACLAVMARLDGPPGLPDGHLTPDTGPIAWIGDNAHKGVSPVPAVTLHSTPEFAARHLDAAVDEWVKSLSKAAEPLLGSSIVEATGHRWRYAEPTTTLDSGAVVLAAGAPIVLAGEVFAGARIEGAHLSGREAARLLLEEL